MATIDFSVIPDPTIVEELMASEQFLCFGPDSLAEARNRGYRPHRSIRDAARDED